MTPRQREMAALVAKGRSNKEIAGELGITVGTVKVTLSDVYRRLGYQTNGANRIRLTLHMLAQVCE